MFACVVVIGLAACSGSSSDNAEHSPSTVQRHGAVACRAVDHGIEISMPKFVGKDVLSAAQLACDIGITIDWAKEPMRMDRVVRSQDPRPGDPTVTGATVHLTTVIPKSS